MPAAFLHGVETTVVNSGGKPITVVNSAVVGIVGISPKGPLNAITAVYNEVDAAAFGSPIPGFSIPKALEALFAQGAGTALVINVFDPTTMVATVTAESQTITNGRAKLAFAPIGATFTLTNSGASTTYVRNTDYTVDDYGNIVVLNFTSIAEGSVVKATYKKLDATLVTAADIIGSVSSGVRKGFKLFEEAFTRFGYTPKIIISPTYCELTGVAAEMIVQADKYRAVTIIDAPAATLPSAAITARGPAGTMAGFQTSNKNVVLAMPYSKAFDKATNATENRPSSMYLAGLIAAVDLAEGYWTSPSNHEIKGIVGMERAITAAINDATTEANQLNAVGITTLFNSFGTGIRAWGNRNASWNSNTGIDSFIAVQRVRNILDESVELAMLPYLDKPINQALVDTIREAVNAFIRTLIGRGAIVDGSCSYNPADNPPSELALGHLTFRNTFVPPPPAERITFTSFIDINLLKFK